MSYDIPPPLQHKEKIVFGLTFEQLAYALPVIPLLIVIFFRLGLRWEIASIISAPFVLIAAFFMFFDGRKRLVYLISYLCNKEVKVNSKKLQEIVNIKKIDDGIVETAVSKLAVLEVIPLNFGIRTDEDKQSIILGFQKFLNSLDFPIQIHISSKTISVQDHFDYLEKKTKDYPALFQSYKQFIEASIVKNNIKNRKFHVIIPEKDDIDIQAKTCEDKLRSLGLKVNRVRNRALLSLFFEYISDKQKKELNENQIVEDYTHFLLAPKQITFFHDYFYVNKTYVQMVVVTGYPHSVEMGFLDRIISSGDNYDISLHIEPFPITDTMIQLNRELQKQQADLYADSQKGIINPSLDIKYKSTLKVLEELQKGQQKLFNVSLYIMCKSSEDDVTWEVKKELKNKQEDTQKKNCKKKH